MPVSPARAAAFDILIRVERQSAYASELLHSAAHAHLSAADHALATELVMGVLRWQSRLDDEIAGASSHPTAKLDLEVLIALRLAVYQLRWLDRIPQRAAIHESVELVKRARKRSAAPLVNAVLRKLAGLRGPECFIDDSASPEDLSRCFSHPLWMIERWARESSVETARQICEHDQSVPVTAIRMRSGNAEASLSQDGIALAPGGLLASARRVTSGAITESRAFRTGEVVIQDEGSQLVAALLNTAAAERPRILDCCAAPGGKTLAMADANPGALITAVELHAHRARLLRKLLATSGAGERIQVVVGEARSLPLSGGFDLVLADVPCSGSGTLARNPEIKWRLKPEDLTELHERQVVILRSALAQAASGGRVIYSTCSLEREENESVVEQVLAEVDSLRLIECGPELQRLKTAGKLSWVDVESLTRGPYLRTIPGVHPCDGFFAAVIEKH